MVLSQLTHQFLKNKRKEKLVEMSLVLVEVKKSIKSVVVLINNDEKPTRCGGFSYAQKREVRNIKQRMTRDGLIKENQATGDVETVSELDAEQNPAIVHPYRR